MNAKTQSMTQLALLDEAGLQPDSWRVRPSDRARRLAVRVLPGGLVEIVVPPGTRPRVIERFVSRHREWIERKLTQYRPVEPAPVGRLPESIRFAANGDCFELRCTESAGAPRLAVEGRMLRLTGDPARGSLMRHALQRFTMRHAHAVLAPWLAGLSAATGLAHARVQIRRQRTRWGSCSRNGTISLNACLLFQEPAVVRYLLIHELAHTRHMNHSQRFWALVERHEPRWRELDAELSRGWGQVPAWALR